jgi:DNA-binding NtrC family response regulator
MKETFRILVVDDDRRMVKTICDILLIKGFKAEPAYTGEEAVAKVKTMELDCVLMDLKMPEIDGIETLKIIKTFSPDLPVVLMSAYASEGQVKEAISEGAYNILAKPVDIQLLLSFLVLLRKEESIVIVDDDPLFCRTLGDILRTRGYQVETETDPDRVLAHMEQKYQLVVILDLKLNNTDGVEVLERIRALYPTKPVILATGYRGEMIASIEKGMQIGAHACIYKPFEEKEILGMIEQVRQRKIRTFLGNPA